jgi:hypothetical protein
VRFEKRERLGIGALRPGQSKIIGRRWCPFCAWIPRHSQAETQRQSPVLDYTQLNQTPVQCVGYYTIYSDETGDPFRGHVQSLPIDVKWLVLTGIIH